MFCCSLEMPRDKDVFCGDSGPFGFSISLRKDSGILFPMQDKDVVFMETAVRLENARTHACIEAVPLPAKAFAKAPLYFKKVGEWLQQRLDWQGSKIRACQSRGGAVADRGFATAPIRFKLH